MTNAASQSRAVNANRRVVVAMSGGVDSSVAAALLVRQGFDVVGVTLQLYDHGAATSKPGSCCAGQDIHDARRVADTLGIPHYVLDYEKRFADSVIGAFADSYVAGETPIPCVTCNSQIKFKDLLDTATELGAEALATGHYIRRADGPDGPELRRAVDAARDQSYFLFSTTRAQLSRLWFPVGAMPKAEVRALARELGLATADKSDSQDICFVPTGRYSDIVAKLRPDAVEPGPILHVDGRELGRHDGILHFTVGQRRGLRIAAAEPLYVVRIEPERHAVIVGPREALAARRLKLRGFNWIAAQTLPLTPPDGMAVHARVRSTQKPKPAVLHVCADGRVEVALLAEEYGVASGQACVLYDDDTDDARILGGGTISGSAASAMVEAATQSRLPVIRAVG